jgi:hypothetical protein
MMQALVTRGAESDALLMFLGSAPGEHGFKQAARSIDAAFNVAHTAIALSLNSALQGVLFVLDELTGLLHSDPVYNTLGLKVSCWTPCVLEANVQFGGHWKGLLCGNICCESIVASHKQIQRILADHSQMSSFE